MLSAIDLFWPPARTLDHGLWVAFPHHVSVGANRERQQIGRSQYGCRSDGCLRILGL